ncbi:MAG TPA: LCP family protein [Actinomycetota bacterium]|nr:LCP family protein [Actinomycetota bacterium]
MDRGAGRRGWRERGSLRRGLLLASAVVALLLSVASAGGYGAYLWVQARLSERPIETRDPETGRQEIGGPCARRACNYLLIGSDSRAGLSPEEQERFGSPGTVGGERADTIILVHVDPTRGRAVVLHFPRDLWVRIPGMGWGKINGAFEGGVRGGGPARVARTVRELTGLRINHVLYVDLAGFEGVVEALGGVRMCVDRPMEDPLAGLHLPRAGCYTFDGSQALAFVRARHVAGDCIPDFARIARQQQFLRAVLAKLLSPSQIVRLPELVPAVAENIRKDPGLEIPEMLALARELQGASAGDADFRAVPGEPAGIFVDGVYTSIVRMAPEARELFRRLREGEPLGQLGRELPLTPPSPANIRVGVFDGGAGPAARRVLARLAQGGYDTSPGLAPAAELGLEVPGSAILFARGRQDEAEVVSRFLAGLESFPAPRETLRGIDVAVVLGAGYELAPPGGGGAGAPPPSGCA